MASGYTEVDGATGRRGVCARLSRTFCYEPERPAHKNELKSRWVVMLLLCCGLASSYYAFDIPSATETALQSAFLGSGTGSDVCVNGTNVPAGDSAAADAFNNNFNLLYSVYAWPNVALPFFGGYISDRLGVRLMGVVFQGFLLLGQLVTALGMSAIQANPDAAWYTAFTGRTLFGLGGESLSVVQSAMIASYFQGGELAFALGVNLALARMGSVLNNEVSAIIATNAPVALAYWVGFGVIAAGFVSMVAVFYLDLKAENRLRTAAGLRPLRNAGLFMSLFGLATCCCRAWCAARSCGAGGKQRRGAGRLGDVTSSATRPADGPAHLLADAEADDSLLAAGSRYSAPPTPRPAAVVAAKAAKAAAAGKGGSLNSGDRRASGGSIDGGNAPYEAGAPHSAGELLRDHPASGAAAEGLALAIAHSSKRSAGGGHGGYADEDDEEGEEGLGASSALAGGPHDVAAPPGADAGSGEEIHLSAVLKFPLVFWVLTLSCVTVYIDVLAFNNNASTFITQKFLASRPLWLICDDDKSSWYLTANTIQSTVYACGAAVTPFIGSFTDYFGLRAALNVVAAAAITGVHATLAWTSFYPALPLVFLGLAYSLYAAALWPCVALVIEPRFQATAYGLVTAVQNLGQAVAPLGIAALMPDARCATYGECVDGWNGVERLFVWIGVCGVACGFALNAADGIFSKSPILNESNAAFKRRQAAEAAAAIAEAEKPLLTAA